MSKKHVSEDVLSKAQTLREQGVTYKQIVEQLNGEISLDQCKRYLKSVKKQESSEDKIIAEIVTLATRPEGCTNYEANSIIYKHKPNEVVTKDVARNIRSKAKRKDSRCFFRSPWIDPQLPLESMNLLYELAQEVMDKISDSVDYYSDTYPNTSRKMVIREIVALAANWTSPEPASTRKRRNEEQAEVLAARVQGEEHTIYNLSAPNDTTEYESAEREKKYRAAFRLTQEEEDIWII